MTGWSNIHFLKFWHFNFSNFQTNFVKIFTKKRPGFKIDFESTDKVLPLQQYLWSEISWQWNYGPLIFKKNLHGRAFCFLHFVKWGKYWSLNLLIFLKCIVVSYSDGNESFTGRLFSDYGPFYSIFFRYFIYIIYNAFHETFVKKFVKLSSFSSNF